LILDSRHNHCFYTHFVRTPSRLTRFLFLPCVALLAVVGNTFAATYYIDYAAGSDGNDGLSKSSPWKRCPGMAGFTGNYSHVAGDRFIFKGGVTWTSCFPLKIGSGGTTTTSDYYGTDPSWFAGGSWSRAVFDFQNISLSSGGGVLIHGSNVTFGDGMDLKNHRGQTYYGEVSTVNSYGQYTNVRITNALIRDWTLATPIASGAGSKGGGVFGGGGGGLTVDHCEFHQLNAGMSTGCCLNNVPFASFNDFHDTAIAWQAGGVFHDNHVHNLTNPTDPATHTEAIQTFSPSTIYNNVIHDLVGNASPMNIWGATSTAVQNSTTLIYNNVMWNLGGQNPIFTKVDSTYYATAALKVFNNTIDNGSGYCVAIEYTGVNQPFGTLVVQNNHFITSNSTPVLFNNTGLGGAAVTTAIIDHNVVQSRSAANAAGYSSSNSYQPTDGSDPTVNAGANLSNIFTIDRMNVSRPSTGAWDAGAYEFTGITSSTPAPTSTPNPTPTPTPKPTATPTPGATATPNPNPSATPAPSATPPPSTPSPTPSGSPPDVGLDFSSDDGAWTITAPFVLNGGIYQPVDTQTNISQSGHATHSFTVPSDGTYVIKTQVDAGGLSSNSFFINIDNAPTDPVMIWDIATTSGVQERVVSWRGSGTFEADEFAPKVFNLTAGPHQLIIYGREPNTKLEHVTIMKVQLPSPPTDLHLIPGS